MKIRDLLPIGSVVILKNGEQPLMIYGVKQIDGKPKLFGKQKEYDYICVIYPHGHLGEEHNYLVNHEDIDRILFRGYEDDEREKFLDELEKIYEKFSKEEDVK